MDEYLIISTFFTDVIAIGYSPNLLIPENNVFNAERFIRVSCFTTQEYENPVWIISDNGFSTGLLMNDETIPLAGGNATIKINRISVYRSEIYINASGVIDFTSNLTCQPQNNPEIQYTIIISSSKNIRTMFMYISS